jgi:DNA-binding CsgD family transcriptional regulator
MDLHEHLSTFSIANSSHLSKISQSLLENYQISYFSYFTLTPEGRSQLIINDSRFCDYYLDSKGYQFDELLCHPQRLQPGIVLWSTLSDEANSYISRASKQFSGLSCGLTVLRPSKVQNGYEAISLGLSAPHRAGLNTLVSNHYLLGRITTEISYQLAPILSKSTYCAFDLGALRPQSFDLELREAVKAPTYDGDGHPTLFSAPTLFNRRHELLSRLSKREQQCVALMREGNSARATGEILKLSRRTVEYYLDTIKGKLSCRSKADLLKLFNAEDVAKSKWGFYGSQL